MSRGPGRIERAIRGLMDTEPHGAWTVEDLCERVYAGVNRVEKKHRVSVQRALRRIVEGDPDWCLFRSEYVGGTLVLVNRANVRSYALGRLKADFLGHYRNPDPRLWRTATEADLLALLEPLGRDHHLVRDGGSWDQHVKIHLAQRDGRTEEAERLEGERIQRIAQGMARIGGRPETPSSNAAAHEAAHEAAA